MTPTVEEHRPFDLSDPRLWNINFAPLFRSKKKIKILYGSRNNGKSEVAAQYSIVRALDSSRPTKGLLVRKYADKIREAQWQTIREIVDKYQWNDFFNFKASPLGIDAYNGNRFLTVGLSDPAGAKSIRNPNFVWIEEGDQLEEDDFRQLMMSIRGEDVEIIITTNPPEEDHWLLKRFFPGATDEGGKFTVDTSFETPDGMFTEVPSSDPDCFIMHTCYKHNPFRAADVDAMMDREAVVYPEEFRSSGLGLIGRKNIGSLWMRAFSRSRHMRPLQYDPGLPLHLTFDQNNLPYSTCVVYQVAPIGGGIIEIRAIKEYCLKPPGNSTEDICDSFIYDFGASNPEVYVYGDPTGSNNIQRKERNEMRSHYDSVKKSLAPFLNNRSMRVAGSAPSIKGRQRFMTSLLNEGTYLRYVVDPSCRMLIGDFEHLVEDENGGFIKKRVKDKETGQKWEERGHTMEATVYFLAKCFADIYKQVARA